MRQRLLPELLLRGALCSRHLHCAGAVLHNNPLQVMIMVVGYVGLQGYDRLLIKGSCCFPFHI